jgi:hypothetical protein
VLLDLLLRVLLGVAATAVLCLVGLYLRRRLLQRRGGTVELSLRLNPRARGRGWVLGIGRFAGEELQWYRVFSLARRPRRTAATWWCSGSAPRREPRPKPCCRAPW